MPAPPAVHCHAGEPASSPESTNTHHYHDYDFVLKITGTLLHFLCSNRTEPRSEGCEFDLVPLDGNLFCSYGAVGVGEVSTNAIILEDLQDFLLNAKDRLPFSIRLRKCGLKLLVRSYQSHTMENLIYTHHSKFEVSIGLF